MRDKNIWTHNNNNNIIFVHVVHDNFTHARVRANSTVLIPISAITLFRFIYLFRLIREGLCDRGSAPSISAISRLLRGHDGDDTGSEKKVSDGKFIPILHIISIYNDTMFITYII